MGFPPEPKNSSQSLGFTPGSRKGRPSWRGALFLVRDEGVKDQEMLPQKGPLYPPFLSREIAPHHLPGGNVLLLFVHFLSNISGLDLVRMQQGNPRVWLTVMGFVHIETKDPSKWLKKRKKKKTFIMKNVLNIKKVEK